MFFPEILHVTIFIGTSGIVWRVSHFGPNVKDFSDRLGHALAHPYLCPATMQPLLASQRIKNVIGNTSAARRNTPIRDIPFVN